MESDSKSDSKSDSIEVADIVLNLNGRDEGRLYFVLNAYGGYVDLADGRTRTLENPKRKKVKHVQVIAKGKSRAAELLRTGAKVTNAELRRALYDFAGANAAEEV